MSNIPNDFEAVLREAYRISEAINRQIGSILRLSRAQPFSNQEKEQLLALVSEKIRLLDFMVETLTDNGWVQVYATGAGNTVARDGPWRIVAYSAGGYETEYWEPSIGWIVSLDMPKHVEARLCRFLPVPGQQLGETK